MTDDVRGVGQSSNTPARFDSRDSRMPIRTFELSSVDGRRFVKATERWVNLRVDHNSTVTLISEISYHQASLDSRFTANYQASEAVVGLIQMEGNILWEGDAKALGKGW